jgi:hypothetical protein
MQKIIDLVVAFYFLEVLSVKMHYMPFGALLVKKKNQNAS